MKIAGVQFPELLLTAIRDHKLVVFAGTGVSMGDPANLPSYKNLALKVAEGTGEVMQNHEPEDRFLGRLKYKQVDVHNRAVQELSRRNPTPTSLHRDLLRLYSEVQQIRIVTTNYDLLFEEAANDVLGNTPEVYSAPALPLGDRFYGIVHIHGSVKYSEEIVLTDSDFGRAYLTEGWARRFLVNLFHNFTVLFIGYSHNDTIVSYLARALPESEVGHRFALTEENDDPQRWKVLGIDPIVYKKPNQNDYSALYECIRRLAEIVRRNILDWQRELLDLAGKPPPLDEEESDIIEDSLKDVAKTRFFVNTARSPEWIAWLDNRKHLDALFTSNDLNERDKILAGWLAEHYAIHYPDDLFLIIAKHGMHLNPLFWSIIGYEISSDNSEQIDIDIFSRWISLLLGTMPDRDDQYILFRLGEQCIKHGQMLIILQIFNAISESHVQIKSGFFLNDEGVDVPNPKVDVYLSTIGDHYVLNKLWENGLKPNLDQVAEPLLKQVVWSLEQRYFKLFLWQKAGQDWDGDSYRRSAIEPHEQDKYPKPIDVLIDSARDCLQWLISNKGQVAAQWCDHLVRSEIPLLRRLAIHTLIERQDLTSDEKINWLLIQKKLHYGPARHEIYRLLQATYPLNSQSIRSAVIKEIQNFVWPDDDDPEKVALTTLHHLEWLYWLHSSAPDCNITKKALDNIRKDYPEFKPREHPDLTHWIGSGWVGPQSPWTVDELLSKSAKELLNELLSFQTTEFLGPSREGLVAAIAEATKKNFEWGYELAGNLADSGEWETDLWSGLMRAWTEMELDQESHGKVLNWLSLIELYSKHEHTIAEALYALVKNNGKPYAIHLLSQANEIAWTLWNHLDRAKKIPDKSNDWVSDAINHPSGDLSQYWLGSLSIWRKSQDPIPNVFNNGYEKIFSAIVQDHSLPGRLGRSILASQLTFLLTADETWTRNNLLPLFYPAIGAGEFQASWDGFLTWGRLTPPVAELLEDAFCKAIPHIKNELKGCLERFIEYYTDMIVYFVKDPLNEWIPELFLHGTLEARCHFASRISSHLVQMDESMQHECWQCWLKKYWENRLQGVPAVLESEESKEMLRWLICFRSLFPEAVDLAIQMPNTPLQQSFVLYDLKDNELLQQYPETVAKLLLYLGESGSPRYILHELPEIIIKIQKSIPPSLKDKLLELVAKLGFTL